MTRRLRGSGGLYQRGRVWWMSYGGIQQSTGKTTKTEAQSVLLKHIAEVDEGRFHPQSRNVTVADLYELVKRDYQQNGKKTLEDCESRWKLHLKPFFGNMNASRVSSKLLSDYIDKRLKADAENGTINRELALLRRAFRLGEKYYRGIRTPAFSMLREQNVRLGFLTDEQRSALTAECRKYGWLGAFFECAVTYGFRKSELLELRVSQVDFAANELRLLPGTTKNSEGRTVVMTSAMRELLTQCCKDKKPEQYVFTWENGDPVRDFRELWEKVTAAAEVPDLLVHDLRRTAVRNMRLRGVGEYTAMRLTGHKTTAVFRRYDIHSSDDLRDAAAKLEVTAKLQNA